MDRKEYRSKSTSEGGKGMLLRSIEIKKNIVPRWPK